MDAPTTRRHPRTLQEAFGPYTNNVVFHGAMKPSKMPTVILTRTPWWLRAWQAVKWAFK